MDAATYATLVMLTQADRTVAGLCGRAVLKGLEHGLMVFAASAPGQMGAVATWFRDHGYIAQSSVSGWVLPNPVPVPC